jgi:hypothetical protein
LFVTAFFPGDDGQAVSWIIHMIFVARVFKFGGGNVQIMRFRVLSIQNLVRVLWELNLIPKHLNLPS